MSVSRKDCGSESVASARDMSSRKTRMTAAGSGEDRTLKDHALDAYRYIDSKDIREYLRKLDYEFSDWDIAYFIWHCDSITMEERHQAWNMLIRDCGDDELADSLIQHIRKDERLLDRLNDHGEAVYTCFGIRSTGEHVPTDGTFGSVGDCVRAFSDDEDIRSIEVTMSVNGSTVHALMRRNGTVMRIADDRPESRDFNRCAPDLIGLPFPFEKGEKLKMVGGEGMFGKEDLYYTGEYDDGQFGRFALCAYTDAEGRRTSNYFPIYNLERFRDDG